MWRGVIQLGRVATMLKVGAELIKFTNRPELFRVVEDGIWDVLKANFE